MAQYTEGQRLKGSDGNIYVVTNGVPVLAPQSITPADPMKPLKQRQQMIDVQKGQADLQKSPFELRKEAAEAAKAELDLKSSQEAYDAAHPKATPTATVFGDAYLKTLSTPDQELVKALADGRLAFPGGFALKAPWWQQKLEQVAQYDPSFDATNYNNRAKARAMLLTGKVGASANALNTAIGHLGLLNGQIGGTASHAVTGVNAVENYVDQNILGQPGITNFKDTAGKLASELTSVYRNGGGAEADVVRQLQSLNPNASEAQKSAVVRNALDLLASKQAANLYQYSIGSGGKPPVDLLDPAAHKVLDQFSDIRDKYFAQPAPALSKDAAALLAKNGGTPPGPPPPTPSGGGDTPPTVGGGTPHADYSAMVGDPQAKLATGGTRTVLDPAMASTVSAFIKKGVPFETAQAFAQSHGHDLDPGQYATAVQFAKQHRGATNVTASHEVPTTIGERLAASPTAAAIVGATSGATAGLSDVAGRALAGPAFDANREALAATNPTADLLGNVAGGAGAMLAGGNVLSSLLKAGVKGGAARNLIAYALKNPVKAAIPGDALYGGVYGASENPDNPLGGAAEGALTGAAGGLAGTGLAKGTGAVLQGVTDPAVQRLKALGIPLTVGEVLGGGAKKAQDAMTSVFGPGNMVARRYADGRQALNQAAFNEAGSVIGAPINAVGQKGIQALDAAKSNAYQSALNPISLDLNDPKAIAEIGNAVNAAKAIPNVDNASDVATSGLANYIGGAAPSGVMSGADFQQAYRGLSRLGRQSGNRIYGHEIGDALGQGQDALVSALQSQNPGAFDAFLAANSANRHLSVLAKAVDAAKSQIGDNGEPQFTAAQLGTAASSNARTYNGAVAAASGARPFNQLATDAQKVMSSKLGDSGTQARMQAMRLATGAGIAGAGGGLGYGSDGGQGAAEGASIPLALLTALGTRRGQQLLTAALIKRTVADQAAGRYLARTPQVGGSILTAAGLPLLTGP